MVCTPRRVMFHLVAARHGGKVCGRGRGREIWAFRTPAVKHLNLCLNGRPDVGTVAEGRRGESRIVTVKVRGTNK